MKPELVIPTWVPSGESIQTWLQKDIIKRYSNVAPPNTTLIPNYMRQQYYAIVVSIWKERDLG